ncbi:hypothetical protein BU24DRAFT_465782 [Aaosphaeria arxii CBS 175.79]|uniref:RapZ C-terminal domain-containing protein n=1 Tax=Aaosphaeria arxii CBS 175.79 TaxID=1450172 RepID=A0A6A5XHD8_9PLEO|nr:uncharacterized protein BU24DRAFT_465782 [Aaosphaeria arxii CBS 175.79]KAF2012221.1 hypothetical protein BU24DRAFT_465782 [Aaosphaeria arxii CBS 175.79]
MSWYEIVTVKQSNIRAHGHRPLPRRHSNCNILDDSRRPLLEIVNFPHKPYGRHARPRSPVPHKHRTNIHIELSDPPRPVRHHDRPQFVRRRSISNPPPVKKETPTVNIISHSASALNSRDVKDRTYAEGRLDQALKFVPTDAYYLYTINCVHMKPPPQHICDSFTGTAEIVKRSVMNDPRAKNAVEKAVHDIVDALKRGHSKVWLESRCVMGTHRSVAIAEVIGEEIDSMGVNVMVQHPHIRDADWQRRRG